jgi:hypothetical protein
MVKKLIVASLPSHNWLRGVRGSHNQAGSRAHSGGPRTSAASNCPACPPLPAQLRGGREGPAPGNRLARLADRRVPSKVLLLLHELARRKYGDL